MAQAANQPTPQQLKECFDTYDKDADGKLTDEDLGTCLRALGKNPTTAELKAIIDEQKGKPVDFAAFRTIFRKPLKGPEDQSKEVLESFKALDTDKDGSFNEDELRQVLTCFGDALSTQELDTLMSEFTAIGVDGSFKYQQLVDLLVTSYPISATSM